MKPYLLALEVHDMAVGRRYGMLPVHCTLVHWFEAEESRQADLEERIGALVLGSAAVVLAARGRETFTAMGADGPVPVKVDTVAMTPGLRMLHKDACDILDGLDARYSTPAYVRDTYVPHVTHQLTGSLPPQGHESRGLYLVGADAPAYGNPRTVLARFALGIRGVE